MCPPGTFAAGTNGKQCYPCTPGYVCLGHTQSATPQSPDIDGGYPCPAGQCPLTLLLDLIRFYYDSGTGNYARNAAYARYSLLATRAKSISMRVMSGSDAFLLFFSVPACPAGYFCPLGSSVETPCPPTTYNPMRAQSSPDVCEPCPANSYSYLSGQAACRPCSSSSTSLPASTTCNCTGKYRFFQPSDGMCICQPNYQFLDADLVPQV